MLFGCFNRDTRLSHGLIGCDAMWFHSSSSSIGTTAQGGALACRTMPFHFFLSATTSLHLLIPIT